MEMTPLEKAQAEMRRRREAGEETERLDPVEKSRRNPKSLRLAINGKCWDCSGESRYDVKHCLIYDCTLWKVRPYQSKEKEEA